MSKGLLATNKKKLINPLIQKNKTIKMFLRVNTNIEEKIYTFHI